MDLTKLDYTNAFVRNDPNFNIPQKEQKAYFWYNVRDAGGLRLSDNGYNHLVTKLDVENWTIDIRDNKLTQRFLLDLDKFIDCPYYIVKGRWPKIVIFKEQTYFTLALHNKNFESFLNVHKV
jgi:hypothetical protein